MKLIDILFLPFRFLMSAFSFLVTAIYTFICNLFLSIYKLFTRKKEGKFISFWERQKDHPENLLLLILYVVGIGSILNIFLPKKTTSFTPVSAFSYQDISTIGNDEEGGGEISSQTQIIYESNVDFSSLIAQNQDTIAYLEVSGTNINYPFVQTTDNEYYLNHDFNHNISQRGAIFADYRNRYDTLPRNNIVYGHHRLDNTMFGPLDNLFTEQYYQSNDHQIFFITPSHVYVYQVFSVYEIDPEIYYLTTSFADDSTYLQFLSTLQSRSIYNFGQTLDANSKILTLSTCNNDNTGRLVAHAVLVSEYVI